MGGYWTRLFDESGFVPRKTCGTGWTPELIWLHIGSDLFIWLAYLSIPLVLIYFTRQRKVPFNFLFILFALFITACGFTHLIDATMFERPVYRLSGIMKALTAVVSWATVFALIRVAPKVSELLATASSLPSDTAVHRPLVGHPPRSTWVMDYIVGILAGVLAVLLRAAMDPLLTTDHAFVLGLLAVVYVSWQRGFGPAVTALFVSMIGIVYFFVEPRNSLVVAAFNDKMAAALFFFCGVGCAALGQAQRHAQKRARRALALALTQKAELEAEVTRRRVVEAAVRQREADLVSLTAQLDGFLLNAPVGIAFFDTDLRYVRVNRVFAEVNRRSIDSHIGKRSAELIPEFPQELQADFEKVLATGEPILNRPHLAGPETNSPGTRWRLNLFPVRTTDGFQVGLGVIGQDVTQAEAAADVLRESEERFRTLTDSTPVLVWVADESMKRTYFNRTWLKFVGRTMEQELGDGWIENIHPTDRDRYLTIYVGAFAAREPFEIEYRLRRADGEFRWVLARGTPRLTAGGAFIGFVGLCLDITDRKVAQDELAESEARFRTMAEGIPQLAWMARPDGHIFWYNRRWYDYTGTTPETMIGWGWQSVHDPNVLLAVLEKWNASLVTGEPFDMIFPIKGADGAFRPFLTRVLATRDESGRIVRWFGTNTDLTQLLEAERAARDNAERFRTLTEAIPQLVWNADAAGRVTYFNTRWRDYTGLTSGAALDDWWPQIVHPDDIPAIQTEWRRALTEDPVPFVHEMRIRRTADGCYRWFKSAVVPLRREDGTLDQWIGSLTDIEDQKKAAVILEVKVQQRTVELVRTTEALRDEIEDRINAESKVRAVALELERSNGELEKFAYVASHDLQEPLRKIQAFGDRLRDRCRDQVTEQGREYIDRMLASAGRMRRLIDDLLAFSRVTTHARPYETVDLNVVLRDVAEDLATLIERTGGTLDVGNLPTLEADPSQIRQLFQNLLGNALKFHQPGTPPVVRIRSETVAEPGQSKMHRVTVTDNGIGFEEKYLGRIFEVFQRLHGREEYEGTGVGLAICKKIVERHGGTIAATSVPGQGSTFVITLPLRQSVRGSPP